MINEIKVDIKSRMNKSLDSLTVAFSRIRTGRANPVLLDAVRVSYYGSDTPLSQVANINVEDARTLAVRVWERNLIPEVEKAIMKSDLGLNPVTAGEVIRVPLPPLTEETRKGFIKQAKQEAENAKIAVRNLRRDAIGQLKDLLKEKEISEDEERKEADEVQKITDSYIVKVDAKLAEKEQDLLSI